VENPQGFIEAFFSTREIPQAVKSVPHKNLSANTRSAKKTFRKQTAPQKTRFANKTFRT
jgi:hypothetical protein